jgi:predicted CoA-substrate-specific enzyme activase
MIFAGVDIGSTTSKCVLIDENKNELAFSKIFTTYDRDESGNKVLDMALEQINMTRSDVKYCISTGYGRKAFKFADKDQPEIIAHGTGTVAQYPDVKTIIDIGGQDSKVIEIEDGLVSRFEMNDKCAAGTGRFFEVLTNRLLQVEMDELAGLIRKAKDPCKISSMCTIFAESEIISYMSQGYSKENICKGVANSITARVISMGKNARIAYQEPILFSGGVANNLAIADIFSEMLGKKVTAVASPQSTAALGAALTALKAYQKANK